MRTTEAKSDRSLARDIGPFGAIATVVTGTLGAGLFVTFRTASSTTGPSVILVIALSGVIAINYSWLATIFPAAGSTYSYITRVFRNRLAGSSRPGRSGWATWQQSRCSHSGSGATSRCSTRASIPALRGSP